MKKVNSREAFSLWADITNTVIFGYQGLDPAQYYPLCASGKMVFFLGYCGALPAAASATMNNAGNGTLEFIATLPDHRRQGLGTAVCRAAIRQLIDDGAYLISLRARPMGVSLYKRLGFKAYFDF